MLKWFVVFLFVLTTPACASGPYHSKAYGAVGDGTTDDTTNLQTWLTACTTDKVACYLDEGSYKITSTLSVAGSIHITGDGKDTATFLLGTTTLVGIDIATTAPATIDNVGFNASGTQTAGEAILVDAGGAGENTESVFNKLSFLNQWNDIVFTRASWWTISSSYFIDQRAQAVIVQNLNNVDSGDSTFSGNSVLFAGSPNNGNQVGLLWESSGGLRINNNKFVNGYRCIQYWLASNAWTGTLLVNGNSCENPYDTGIFISPQLPGGSTNGTIQKMEIVGNEFLLIGSAYGIRAYSTSGELWLIGLAITGNSMQLNGLADSGASPHGIDLNYATDLAISGNMIWCTIAGTNDYGILIDNTVQIVGHGGNNVSGCTHKVSDNSTSPPTAY